MSTGVIIRSTISTRANAVLTSGTEGQVLTSHGPDDDPTFEDPADPGVTDGDKGDITVSSSGAVWTIDNNAITDAKLRDSAAVSIIGRSANSSGDPADIAASANGQVLARMSNAVAFTDIEDMGHWSPLTNGDVSSPELIFASGDTIAVWTPA